MTVKYPDIEVQLTGQNGNAYFILGAVEKAMESHGVEKSEIDKYMDEATSGDYNKLLQTTMRWVNVY